MLYIKTDKKFRTRKSLILYILTEKIASYHDKECIKIQCEAKKFRSVTDLHEIVTSYFPKTSFNAMLRIITELIDESNQIALIWCTQVKKVVIKYVNNSERKYITNVSRREFYESIGVDGYSLKDYETIINEIKNK